jgi:hypothetical protein
MLENEVAERSLKEASPDMTAKVWADGVVCPAGNISCRRMASSTNQPCRPQKLSERPLAPRNTHGVAHREWT